MKKFLKTKSIRTKLSAIVILVLLIPTLIFLSCLAISLNRVNNDSQAIVGDKVLGEVKSKLQSTVQTVVTSMEELYKENESKVSQGAMTEDKSVSSVLGKIDAVRYGDSGYFFVYKYDGTRLVAPENESQAGQNLLELTDSKGNKPVQEFIKAAKAGGDYISYVWLNPQTNQQEDKISYVAPLKFGNLELAVGTDSYLPMVLASKNEISSSINKTKSSMLLTIILLISAVLVLAFILVYIYLSKTIAAPINKLIETSDRLASGNMAINNMGDINISNGEMGKIVKSFNKIFDRMFWYEALLDSIPFLISATDMDMNWTFVNKSAEESLGMKRKDLLGKQCSNWNPDICKTENCAVKRLKSGKPQTLFENNGLYLQIDTSFILDKSGEKVGHIEVIRDNTLREKSRLYQKMEVERLANNLKLLASGNLELDMDVSEADVYTKNDRENFMQINNNLAKVKDAIGLLVEDSKMLTHQAIEGRLDTRADTGKHQGNFKAIIEGVNETLDTIVGNLEAIPTPIQFIDKDFKIQYVNRAAAALLGRTKSQLLGINCSDAWNTRSCRTSNCPCMRAMNEDKIIQCENDCSVGGKIYDIFCSGAPLKDKDGKIIGSFEFITDQTELKKVIRVSKKVSEYQSSEVAKLTESISKLAQGDLQIDITVSEGDHDTAEVRATFDIIATALKQSVDSIRDYVSDISRILEEISSGNLNLSVTDSFKGDFVEIRNSLNLIIKSLNEIFKEIGTASEQVSSGAKQVADSSQALSQGSTEQASAIEELTASMEEIASQTKQNAVNANQASEHAVLAKDNAMNGNTQMHEMLRAMKEINESSTNISKIIKVIDEIAFQTNILALNAAVEAARAGQHGKGFAVVAEEVRNLAARSANAAKETTALIEGSIRKVEDGTKIANDTASALNTIVDGITKVTSLIGNIATSSNEQATGITQVNQGIFQVSQVTQTNSATAQESAAASEELSSQAEILKDMVSRFKVKKNINLGHTLDEPDLEAITHFENSAERKKLSGSKQKRESSGTKNSKNRINLNDSEFGKY